MKKCVNARCRDILNPKATEHDGCNWLDWMVEGGGCPHCGRAVQEITTVTPLGKLMDFLGSGGAG